MKLIHYARVSTQGQGDNTSIEQQKKDATEWAYRNGHEIIATFTEIHSGSDNSRPQLRDAVLASIELADGFIATKVDRFARNHRDCLNFHHGLAVHGKALVILELGIDTSTAIGKLMLNFYAQHAEIELQKITQRMQAGRAAKKEKGRYAGGNIPFGYSRGDDDKLIENPDEQAIISLMRRHRKSGKSFQKIADFLNENGYQSRSGKPWNRNSINSILNPEVTRQSRLESKQRIKKQSQADKLEREKKAFLDTLAGHQA